MIRNVRWYGLDENGDPVPMEFMSLEHMRYMEGPGRLRLVAHTRDAKVSVSTVFLCLNHAFTPGPPILWETMVFGGELHQEQDRYASRRSAQLGHQRMCARVWGRRQPVTVWGPASRPEPLRLVEGVREGDSASADIERKASR